VISLAHGWLRFAWLVVAASSLAQTPQPPTRQTALALEQQGKYVEAEAAWTAILKAQPQNPEPYAQIGLIEARQQRYKEAIPYYRKALALNPAVPGLRLNLALALFKAGELQQAIPEFEALLKAAPPNSSDTQRCTVLLGMSYYGLARYQEAAPLLQQAADRDPKNLPLLLTLAHSYLWSKQMQKVLDVYHLILEIDPDSAEADMIAGEALDDMKDNEGSTKMFRAAVKADPKLPDVHFGLAYLLWTQKKYPEAVPEFQAELANDPNHEQALLYLGDTYIQMNRFADAQPLLEKVAALSPEFGLAHLDLGIVFMEAGHNDDALRELTLAVKQMPDDVNVHWRLGRLYRTLGRKDEARAEFDKAASINKAADDDLYQKIANGRKHSPAAEAPTTPAPQTQP
jgi:tetratricopeptide (TPR) repeat protein